MLPWQRALCPCVHQAADKLRRKMSDTPLMRDKKSLTDVPYKANLWLQLAMLLNVYLSAAWALLYGFHILYNLSHLKDFHGIFVIIAYMLAVFTECFRLHAGYSGNLRAKIGDLSMFLITTPLVQLPLLLFLFLSTKSLSTIIHIHTALIFGLMLCELCFGVLTWRRLSYHQSELYRLKRQMFLQMQTKQAT